MNKQVFSMDFYGKNLSVEVGELAKQANGAVLVRYNDTVILSTVVAGKEPKDVDFFPLTVTYEEKLYSVGKIPGGFLKREGRPSEHGTLTARMIDRPIRPLFADGFRNEVQSINTVLSVDQDATPEMTAMLGASLALCISDIPFNGPIAGVNVGLVDGEFIVNGSPEQLERSLINLEVAGTKDAINMVEADAKEVSEEVMLEALLFGHEKIKELIAFQEKVIEACGKEKIDVPLFELDENLVAEVSERAKEEMVAAVSIPGKLERYDAIDKLIAQVNEEYDNKEYESDEVKANVMKQVDIILHDLEKDEVLIALRDKVPTEQFLATHNILQNRGKKSNKQHHHHHRHDEVEKPIIEEEIEVPIEDDETTLMKDMLKEIEGEGTGAILDEALNVTKEVKVEEIYEELKNIDEPAKTVIFDGVISQRLVDVCSLKGIENLVAFKSMNIVKKPDNVKIITMD